MSGLYPSVYGATYPADVVEPVTPGGTLTEDELRLALRLSHRAAIVVEVLAGGSVIDSLTADASGNNGRLITGSVTLDGRAASRGRADLTIVDDGTFGLVPDSVEALLAPYGNELRISRGLITAAGTTQTTPLVVVRIDSCKVDDTSEGLTIALAGLDRSGAVIDAKFEAPFEVAAGTNVEDAIIDTLQPAVPGYVEYVFPGSAFTTPLLRANEGEDRWKFAQDIATASGLDLFFNADGNVQLQPVTEGDPVVTIAEGIDGVLLNASRDWKREGSCNRVIVTGENTGGAAPVRGVATDDNPLSPTYYFGAFGKVPTFVQSQFVATTEQALAAANVILRRQLGTTQQVAFGTLFDPALIPGAAVDITRVRAGIVSETHVLDTVAIPLTVDAPLTATTRAVQVLS